MRMDNLLVQVFTRLLVTKRGMHRRLKRKQLFCYIPFLQKQTVYSLFRAKYFEWLNWQNGIC